MGKRPRALAMLAAAAGFTGSLAGPALAQGKPPTPPSVGGPPPQYAVPTPPPPPATPAGVPGVAAAPGLPLLYVTSVEIVQTSVEPKLDIIRVIGLASSQGWSEPELVPTFVGKSFDDVLDLQFIATVPPESQPAEGFIPLGAVFTLEQDHPFKGVRVRAAENVIEVKPMAGVKQANVTVDSCKDCIGKKFAERGQAQAGQQNVVREEDLPKVLRWINPSRGIRGLTHNPNRLNLILGDDNTIVQAYWE